MPASASTYAAMPPPAPEPTIRTSAWSRVIAASGLRERVDGRCAHAPPVEAAAVVRVVVPGAGLPGVEPADVADRVQHRVRVLGGVGHVDIEEDAVDAVP